SAKVTAPSSAMRPPTPQAASAEPALPLMWATSRGLKKMPTPMMAPTTTQVASHRPRTRGSVRSMPGGYPRRVAGSSRWSGHAPRSLPPAQLLTAVLDALLALLALGGESLAHLLDLRLLALGERCHLGGLLVVERPHLGALPRLHPLVPLVLERLELGL